MSMVSETDKRLYNLECAINQVNETLKDLIKAVRQASKNEHWKVKVDHSCDGSYVNLFDTRDKAESFFGYCCRNMTSCHDRIYLMCNDDIIQEKRGM